MYSLTRLQPLVTISRVISSIACVHSTKITIFHFYHSPVWFRWEISHSSGTTLPLSSSPSSIKRHILHKWSVDHPVVSAGIGLDVEVINSTPIIMEINLHCWMPISSCFITSCSSMLGQSRINLIESLVRSS